jgi:arylsulfatase A-like enzyme
MSSGSSGFGELAVAASSPENHAGARLGTLSILVLSAWCGLCAGLCEVGITILRKNYFDPDQFYRMSGHFVWLVPSVNVLIFVVVGLILSAAAGWWTGGQKAAIRVLATLMLIPPFWAAFPRIYGVAGVMLVTGIAVKLVPALERRRTRLGKVIRYSLPAGVGLVIVMAASCWAADRLKLWHEASRPLPSSNAPNILLIVLDTVAAGHLSLLGYDRPTSPTLEELASRGTSFRRARATSSWTLPSHASMFTGRWPHELSTGWRTPLDGSFPTIAEYLGARGYATAGFVGNVYYCASDSGLARGFAVYRDYIFPRLTVLHLAVIVSRLVDGFRDLGSFCADWLELPYLTGPAEQTWQLLAQDRKGAAVVNREFLNWLSERRQPDRPFFAFLNYLDAHDPYELLPTGIHRFGAAPAGTREMAVMHQWSEIIKRGPSQWQVDFARDSYDDCVAGLDEELGLLIDELEHRSILERTWVIVSADHGESFGEHPGVFLHGATLYQTESHVPLMIIPPGGAPLPRVVTAPVSLRDLAATIIDISGLNADSPFPGSSLVREAASRGLAEGSNGTGFSPALAELANEIPPYSNPSEYDAVRWPLAALIDGDWSYFRRDGGPHELLFNLREDPGEQHNRANDPAMLPTLERMRKSLTRLTGGVLTPDRFNP